MAATKKKTPEPTTESEPEAAPLEGFTAPEEPVTAPVEPVPEPEPTPVSDAPVTDDSELKQAMLRVLKQRNLRCSVPTLVDFRMKGSQRRRYTIIDIDRDTMEAVWRLWCEAKGSYDHEAFILMLHDVMESGLPRVFRQVDPLRLED